MAKRKRLFTPDADELAQIARGFVAEPGEKPPLALGPGAAPIARVAAEAAGLSARENQDARLRAAEFEAEARQFREAKAGGLVAVNLALDQIETEHLARDRIRASGAEMEELMASIRSHGLRLPVEVLELEAPGPRGRPYGLISGWRRIAALEALRSETGDPSFGTVKALVRAPKGAAEAYVSMVEENEIRSDLSHYERGRIAVVAAGQGAFTNVEAAVNALFAAGSKAKRSKIRSFAAIHEELGDLLRFGPSLSERAGLRLANALRDGAGPRVRQALESGQGTTAEAEWELMELILESYETGRTAPTRKLRATPRNARTEPQGKVTLANGVVMDRVTGDGYIAIRFTGRNLHPALVVSAMRELERLLGPGG